MSRALAASETDIRRRIVSERLRLVWEQTPRAILLTLLAATAVAMVGARSLPLWVVLMWWLAMAGLAWLRYLTGTRHRDSEGDEAAQRYWLQLAFYTVFASGAGWGLGGLLLAYEAALEYQLLVLLILAGIAGAALPFLSMHLPSFVGFILAITVPNVSYLLWLGGRLEIISGVLLTVYMVALLYNARRVNELLDETLNLRFHNEAMAQSLQRDKSELEALNAELERLSHIDGLTQLANRRYFDERFQEQWQRGVREQASVAVLMIDIDEFKKYNDSHGHAAGDDCLRRVAKTIEDTLRRPSDLAARYGGEEFVVLLANTDAEGAMRVARELLGNVRALDIEHLSSCVVPRVTVSIGAAAMVPHRDTQRQQLLRNADLGLYESKRSGRDRVTVWPPQPVAGTPGPGGETG